MVPVAPWFLLAALAAAVPVILHMINRQKAKDLPFSTLRFLRISVQKTRRRRRIHDAVLMLVRMAVLVLIAVGLSDLRLTSFKSFLGRGDSAAVIILDNSASMGLVDENRVRFETALGAVQQILAEIPEGNPVGLILTSGRTFPEAGKLHRTRDPLLEILNQCAVTYEGADLGLRLQQARRLLAGSDAVNKDIYLVTDMQECSWKAALGEKASEEQLSDDERKARAVPLTLVDCARTPKSNQAIREVKIEAAVPVAGLQGKALVKVYNAFPIAQSRLVELYLDEAKAATSPALNLPPGGEVTYPFPFTFPRGGLLRGEVRLVGDDGSKLDDRWFFTLEVDQSIPIAIAGPPRHEIHYLDDTFYVEHALAPRRGAWAIQGSVYTVQDLLALPSWNFKVMFLVNLPALDPAATERLRTYIDKGGHVVWIAGENVQSDAYNQMNEQAKGALLPAPLGEVRTADAASGRDSWHIAFLDKQHPALAQLLEPASLYQSVLVYKHVRIEPGPSGGAWVMARLDDGEPLLVQKKMGRGSVTLLGTSAHVGWTNLPLRPIFLPLLARLTFELVGAEQTRYAVTAGAPLVVPFDPANRPLTVEVVPPSGVPIRLPNKGDDGQAAPAFRYEDTHDVGIYTMRLLEGTTPGQVACAVNVDPDEALPAKVDLGEFAEWAKPAEVILADDPDDLSSTFRRRREGDQDLWPWFLAGVLVVLVFETFLSNRLSPKGPEDAELAKQQRA
jgi:hypothetical protein